MKITTATVKKIIRNAGLNVEDFEISGGKREISCNVVDTDETACGLGGSRAAKSCYLRGNLMLEIVVNELRSLGAEVSGLKAGYGAWFYRWNPEYNGTRELAGMNID